MFRNPGLFTFVFVLYNVVVIIVTMNIFLSIVLDAYSVVKDFPRGCIEERAQEDGRDGVDNRATESSREHIEAAALDDMMVQAPARRGRRDRCKPVS